MSLDFSELIQLIEELIELFDSASYLAYDINTLLTIVTSIIGLLVSMIATVLSTGIGIIVFVGSLIVSAVLFIVLYIVQAIPIYAVAKKLGYQYAWLAWIPICQQLFCLYVLMKASGKEQFEFANGKIKMQGTYSFLIYLLFYFFGNAIVTLLIGIVNILPGIGQILGLISTILYFLPDIVFAIITYVYMRDILDLFKPDHKSNCTHSAIVTVLDALITSGLAQIIYLFTLLKMDPIQDTYYLEQDENPVVTYEPEM